MTIGGVVLQNLNSLYEDMNFIQNNFFSYKDFAICGTRGMELPRSYKIYNS